MHRNLAHNVLLSLKRKCLWNCFSRHFHSLCLLTSVLQALHDQWESQTNPDLDNLYFHSTSSLMLFRILTCVVMCCFSLCLLPFIQLSPWFFPAEGCLVLVVGGLPLSSSHVGLQSAASNNQESACSSEALRSSLRSTDWVLCACCALPL